MTDQQKQYAKIIGANIRRLRKERGLSRKDFQVDPGVDPVRMGQIERGEFGYPDFGRVILEFSARFGVEPWRLLKPPLCPHD